ncbi:retrovirus-related pol polyprotein from transposon TNT 1-94 [Tanacetum coccineum]|uniref:Retrovirus-related pol polyprotein from transposon TNT 1-94 n=1 Tax=Tanacetum coccineum TaxID=301880 RepID=A0ABQ5IAW2_9ASTR
MEFCANYKTLLGNEIEGPEALDFADFGTMHEGQALQNLDQLCRHNAKEKVTLEDLFFLHNMDGGALVDVPWNIAKFLFDKAKGAKKKSMIVGAYLIGRIARYNGLGLEELVDDMLNNSEDEATAAEARRAQDEVGGVRHHPNMSFTNRLRAIDDRLGDIDTNIYKLSNDVEELTNVISGMSEQYDQF